MSTRRPTDMLLTSHLALLVEGHRSLDISPHVALRLPSVCVSRGAYMRLTSTVCI
ncbi:hypothetical protein CALVIDRAFT_537848 [Calocera viscosa TUFC12733]|uniref:Uncharacterized protein n=1 Tax=Calocera viscosa (strain TUFC12733) TaxID=1330018 RepID=A0A167LNU8_CALVF|nr:hypothetical protein CALVIDRAFT_537848 [Calocera viscosa TUFC12733]